MVISSGFDIGARGGGVGSSFVGAGSTGIAWGAFAVSSLGWAAGVVADAGFGADCVAGMSGTSVRGPVLATSTGFATVSGGFALTGSFWVVAASTVGDGSVFATSTGG